MVPTVFDVFSEVDMDLLAIKQGGVLGDTVEVLKTIKGVFKERSGQTSSNGMEAYTSSATAHVHPEDFVNGQELVGQGIRYGGVDYQIVGVTAGTNFENHKVEHYTLTLQVAKYGHYGESE